MKKFKLFQIQIKNHSKIKSQLIKILIKNKFIKSNTTIVIGGDGFMSKTLKETKIQKSFFME